MSDEITETLLSYVEAFGPLPDSRLMSEEAAGDIVELCRMALKRGKSLTPEETGVSDDVPENTTI